MADTTVIKRCSCNHLEQDKIYGNGNRLHNYDAKNNATCTVCGTKSKK